MLPITSFQQRYSYDCGGAVLVSLLRAYGIKVDTSKRGYRKLLKTINCGPAGLYGGDMIKALKSYGLTGKQFFFSKKHKLAEYNEQGFPIIVSWHSLSAHSGHYSIIADINNAEINNAEIILIDPNHRIPLNIEASMFYKNWFIIDAECSKTILKRDFTRAIDIRPMIVVKPALK